MKKLLSILISLAMIFTLFAAIPASAEGEELTGTFNILDKTMSIPDTHGIYLKLNRALTKEDSITVSAYSTTGGSTSGDPWKNVTLGTTNSYKRPARFEVVDDIYIRIYPTKNDAESTWAFASSTQGNVWKIYVKNNGTTIGTLEFHSQGKKINPTSFPTSGQTVPVDHQFTVSHANNNSSRIYWSGRSETVDCIISDGEKTLVKGTDYSVGYTGGVYTIKPTTTDNATQTWEPGKTYTAKLQIYTKSNYDRDGNQLDPVALYTSQEWTFTTEGATVEPEPEPELEPLTATFNVPELAKAVPYTQQVFLNLNRELTAAEKKDITVETFATAATSNGSNPWSSTAPENVKTAKSEAYEVSEDGKSIRVYPINGSGDEISWRLASLTGYLWRVKVTIGSESYTVNFNTQNDKTAANDTNTFPEAETLATLDQVFKMDYLARTYWSGRNEVQTFTLTDGEKVLTEGVDYTFAYTTTGFIYTVSPVDAWKPGRTYTATLNVSTNSNYAQNGTVLEPYTLLEQSWSFTTEGEYAPDPEVEAEPRVTFENGVATIINYTVSPVENAFLILVAKNAETGLIENIWVEDAFELKSMKTTTQDFELQSGQTFDYFLLDSKLAPIINNK